VDVACCSASKWSLTSTGLLTSTASLTSTGLLTTTGFVASIVSAAGSYFCSSCSSYYF
jgi:hypothetical protein